MRIKQRVMMTPVMPAAKMQRIIKLVLHGVWRRNASSSHQNAEEKKLTKGVLRFL